MNNILLNIVGTLTNFASILGAILVLLLMITIHEFGHYLAGKLLKFKINEFSIGFGKALYSKTKSNGEIFSIRLIPLGGYCAFEGEDDASEDKSSFNAQAPWKRLIVLFFGAFFNFLSAIIFNIALLAVIGNGMVNVAKIDHESNPNISQLQVGDLIEKVNGEKLTFFNGGVRGLTQYIKGETDITLTIVRDGERKEIIVRKYATEIDGKKGYLLGINTQYNSLSVDKAILTCIPFTFEMGWECLVSFGKLVVGQYSLRDVGGPITTIGAIAGASAASLMNLLLLVPIIAVNLAVFNLLPIPALDGSKMVFVLIEWIRKKPINRELENKIHTVGLIILFGFVILVDLIHLLGI